MGACYLECLLTEQSPCGANRFSASQETPAFYGTPEVHYRVYKITPPVPILRERTSLFCPSHVLKIYLNIIFPSEPGSSKWSLPLNFPH